MVENKPKILVLDIETSPSLSYHWRMFKENINLDQVVEPGRILCVGLKWFGNKDVAVFSEWDYGYKGMLENVHQAITEADAVVTKNGDRFDIPWLLAEFLKVGLNMPPPITSIDLEKTIRYKLNFLSNKLDYVAEYLGVGKKLKHEGFPLWKKVLDGYEPARRRMMRYCARDVKITEKLYKKLRPFIVNHPHMGLVKGNECGACGSPKVQSRGWRRTKNFRIQRLHCQSCNSWQDGRREKVT